MSETWEQIKGHKDELVGKVKEVYGEATDDAKTQAEGVAQQVEGDARVQAASGRGNEAELKSAAQDKADVAEELIKQSVTETHESVQQKADERLKEAIDEGQRLKEEARAQAEQLRQDAIQKNEAMKEEDREAAVEANKYPDEIADRAQSAIDEVLNRRKENE